MKALVSAFALLTFVAGSTLPIESYAQATTGGGQTMSRGYTGLMAGDVRWSGSEDGNGGRTPAAGLGPALCSRRQKGGDPVTLSPTVICEVVGSLVLL